MPLIIITKRDTIKVVLDARQSNSITDQSFESYPIEPFFPNLHALIKNLNLQLTECMLTHMPL